ncbi:MAG: response regulator [Pseudomonadota bacterium]
MMAHQATVYAVDDDPTTLTLLEALLRGEDYRVETYDSAETFLMAFRPEAPGCLLLDVCMPGMSGLELQEILAEGGNEIPIIFVSGIDSVRTAVDVVKAGAVDFIEKPVQAESVRQSVKRAVGIDIERRYRQLVKSQIQSRLEALTPRELEIMRWVAQGQSSKQIAHILDISTRTVEVHRGRIMTKMNAANVVQLLDMLYTVGHLTPET